MKPYPGGNNILPISKDLPIKMISEDFAKVPVEEDTSQEIGGSHESQVTSQRTGSGVTKMQSQ